MHLITEKQRTDLITLINRALFPTSDILEEFNRFELDNIFFKLSILYKEIIVQRLIEKKEESK